MTVRVDEVMRRQVFQISPDATVAAAARELLLRDVESLVVIENDRLVGIVTERDILAAILPSRTEFMSSDGQIALSDLVEIAAAHAHMSIRTIMTSPVIVTEPATSLMRALGTMVSKRLRRLPVQDPGTRRLVGVLTRRDILGVVFLSPPLREAGARGAVVGLTSQSGPDVAR